VGVGELHSAWSAGGPAALLQALQSRLTGVAAGWLQPHIVLLDVGMATELSPEDQTNMIGLFRRVRREGVWVCSGASGRFDSDSCAQRSMCWVLRGSALAFKRGSHVVCASTLCVLCIAR
jgi:hypothetical protein